MHRDFAQVLAATGTRHALTTAQLETCAMHRAYQQAILAAQELARRPIKATTCVRADIEPGVNATAGIAMHDQRFRIAINDSRDLVQAVRGQAIHLQPGQW